MENENNLHTKNGHQDFASAGNDDNADLDDSPVQNVSTTQSTSAQVTGRGGVRARGETHRRGRGRVRTCGGRHNVAPNVSLDWQQNGRTRRRRFNFVGDPGRKVVLDDTTSSLSVFKTFFSDELVQHIVHATNTYAEINVSSPHVQEPLENTKVCLNCRNLYPSMECGYT